MSPVKEQMRRTQIDVLKTRMVNYLLLAVAVFMGFLVSMEWGQIQGLIRYDKYPIYMNLYRGALILLVLAIGLYVYSRHVFPLSCSILFPINLFMVLFLSMVFPGVLLTSGYDPSGMISFYSYLAAFLFFIMGGYVAARIMEFKGRRELKIYWDTRIDHYHLNGSAYITVLFLLLISLGLSLSSSDISKGAVRYVIEFLATGGMPGSARSVADSRIAAYHAEDYRQTSSILFAYASGLVLPLTSMFILLNGYIRRNKLEIIFGAILSVMAFFLLVSGGSRLRGMFFILFVFVVLSHVRRLKLRTVAAWGMLVLVLLVLQTIALGRMIGGQGYVTNIVMSLNRVVERIILVKGYVTQQVFHYIPWQSDFRSGETYQNALMGTLDNRMLFSEEMSQYIYGVGGGTAGPQAFGEAYANFGVIGVLVLAVMLGFIMQIVTVAFVRQRKRDVLTLVFSAYVVVLLGRVGYGDLFTFKTNGMHVLLVLWIGFIGVRLMGLSWEGGGALMKAPSNSLRGFN